MRFIRVAPLALILGTQVVNTLNLEPRANHECSIEQCSCEEGCFTLHKGHTCCSRKNRHDRHICGPNKECCGDGCCHEEWSCGKDEMCYPPPKRLTSGRQTCFTTVITVTKAIPVYPTSDKEASSTPIYGGTSQLSVFTTTHSDYGVSTNLETSRSSTSYSSNSSENTDTDGTGMVPTSVTAPTISTLPDGQVSTYFPSGSDASTIANSASSGANEPTSNGNTAGFPTETTTPITVTNSEGQVSTIFPPGSTGGVTSHETSATPPSTTDSQSTGPIVTTSSNGVITTVSPGTEPPETNDTPTTTATPIVTTNSDGQIITTLPAQGSSRTGTPDESGNTDGQGPTSHIFTTDGDGGSTESTFGGTVIVTTNSNGDVTTIMPPGQDTTNTSSPITPIVTTNANGQATTILPSGQEDSTALEVTTPTVITNPDGHVTTVIPPGEVPTTTQLTASTVVTNTDGQVTTIPSPGEETSTSPPATPTVITNTDGSVTTLFPPGKETTSSLTITPTLITNSDGQVSTVVPPGESTNTSGSTVPTLITNSDGQVTTTQPPGEGSTTSSLTSPTVITDPDGQITTLFPPGENPSTTVSPSSTDTDIGGFIIPVTTEVGDPEPTDDGFVIPCNMWFFNICIGWDDWKIFGWGIILPPGSYPPGPPPPFTNNPTADFHIEITGTLPEWPEFTIGPDNRPTFSDEPTDCETESAELCVSRTSYGVSISDTETVTTTTATLSTCGTVYGCNVQDATATQTTSETETSTAEPISHIIYPMEGRNESQVNFIEDQLFGFVQDPADVYTAEYDNFGVLFWRLNMTIPDADKLRSLKEEVASVIEECDNDRYPCWDPTVELKYQDSAKPQLTYISWPNTNPATAFEDLLDTYYFDGSAGEDIPAYVIDTGATASHPEFDLIRDKMDVFAPLPDYDGVQRTDDSATNHMNSNMGKAHGTAMLSLVAGQTLGVAKLVKPYVVRLPRKYPFGIFTAEDFLETMAATANRMDSGADGTTAGVVCLAHYFPHREMYRKKGDGTDSLLEIDGETFDESLGFRLRLTWIIDQMIEKGYLIVTGTGNGGDSFVDGWPANFGKTNDEFYKPSVLVVGGIRPGSVSGDHPAYGNVDLPNGLPHVYGPAEQMTVADGNMDAWSNPDFGYTRSSQGTSDATAMTTGLAAYFLKLIQLGELKNDDGSSVGNSPQAIKDYILVKSWSRGIFTSGTAPDRVERNGIWNGVDPTKQGSCKWNPNSQTKLRRQNEGEGEQCKLPLSSSSTTTTTTTTTTSFAPPTDLPTLTGGTGGVTISTPDGSSCQETGTITQCVIGSGGRQACVENPTCISWVATTIAEPTTTVPPPEPTTTEAPPEPTKTVAPLEIRNTVCNDEADFPGHADIAADSMEGTADRFCVVDALGLEMGPGDDPLDEIKVATFDINFEYIISWIDGCETTVDKQDLYEPLGSDGKGCKDIFADMWHGCINGGVGGYVDVGCLRYYLAAGV